MAIMAGWLARFESLRGDNSIREDDGIAIGTTTIVDADTDVGNEVSESIT